MSHRQAKRIFAKRTGTWHGRASCIKGSAGSFLRKGTFQWHGVDWFGETCWKLLETPGNSSFGEDWKSAKLDVPSVKVSKSRRTNQHKHTKTVVLHCLRLSLDVELNLHLLSRRHKRKHIDWIDLNSIKHLCELLQGTCRITFSLGIAAATTWTWTHPCGITRGRWHLMVQAPNGIETATESATESQKTSVNGLHMTPWSVWLGDLVGIGISGQSAVWICLDVCFRIYVTNSKNSATLCQKIQGLASSIATCRRPAGRWGRLQWISWEKMPRYVTASQNVSTCRHLCGTSAFTVRIVGKQQYIFRQRL